MDLLRSTSLPHPQSLAVWPCRVCRNGCCYSNPCLLYEAGEATAYTTSTPASADPRLNTSVTHSVNPISTESNRQPLASQPELQID